MTRAGRGDLYAAVAAVLYGSSYVATAYGLRSFAPLALAVDRSLLAALLVVALIALRRRTNGGDTAARPTDQQPPDQRPPTVVRATHLLVIALFGGPIFLASMNLAVVSVGATIASFVAGLYAILAAVFAPFLLREPIRLRALVGFVIAVVGTGLLAELDLFGPSLAGIAWGLAAAVSFALFLDLSRKWARSDGFDGLAIALSTMSATTLGLGAVVAVSAPATLVPASVAPEAAVALLWLVAVAAAGQALAVMSLARVAAARTAAFLLLNPISATVLSFVLLAERPSSVQVLGGVLVLAGMAAATIVRPARPAAS